MKMSITYKLFILVFAFCVIQPVSAVDGASDEIWWKVELRIAVTGEYSYQKGNKGFDGNYSFTALVLGTMMEDEGDFIFVQAFEEISGQEWQENIYAPGSQRQFNRSGQIKPGTTLNYVFRRKGELSFDFEIEPVTVPGENSILVIPGRQLHLPESAGDDSVVSKRHYNKGIVTGSNRAEVSVRDMYNEKEMERVFKWKWLESPGSSSWKSSHQVTATLKILRLGAGSPALRRFAQRL